MPPERIGRLVLVSLLALVMAIFAVSIAFAVLGLVGEALGLYG